MKNSLLKTILSLFIGFVLLAGCGKDDPKPLYNSEILTNGDGEWSVTAMMSVMGTNVEDEYANSSACLKDDVYYFSTDGTFQKFSGPSKCYGEPNVLNLGTWKLSANGKKFIVQLTGYDPTTQDIMQLDATTFKIKSETVTSGVTRTRTTTYTKL